MSLDHVLHQRDQILGEYVVPQAAGGDSDEFAGRVVVGVRHSVNDTPIFSRPFDDSRRFSLEPLILIEPASVCFLVGIMRLRVPRF